MKKWVGTVCVIGQGYIGLPTAAMFASRKIKVIGVDINKQAVRTINRGKTHIIEPELDMLVHAAVNEGYLRAKLRPEKADAFIITVPTPFKDDHEPDMTYVRAAADSIAPYIKKGDTVILESTSPVGTTEKLAQRLKEARPDLRLPINGSADIDVHIAYCPERVLPGHIVKELVANSRIIGGLTEACSARAAEIYSVFVEGEMLFTNARTAEMCKLTENAFRDVNIAFANELSIICEKLDINVWDLIKLANHHPRVDILQPGCGVGGHCIAVDPWFIVSKTPDDAKLIHSARRVNDGKPDWVLKKVDAAVTSACSSGALFRQDVKIACLGLAFKPDIDDLRESPAVKITIELAKKYPGQVVAVEPNIEEAPPKLAASGVKLATLEEVLKNAHVLVLLVDHKEFKRVTPKLLPGQLLCDTKGIW
jgi:UDP-N-acetyl-D-mannosaminuronic acid dehydrogenase